VYYLYTYHHHHFEAVSVTLLISFHTSLPSPCSQHIKGAVFDDDVLLTGANLFTEQSSKELDNYYFYLGLTRGAYSHPLYLLFTAHQGGGLRRRRFSDRSQHLHRIPDKQAGPLHPHPRLRATRSVCV